MSSHGQNVVDSRGATIFRKKYKEVLLQRVTAKKEQVLSITFLQSDWFIFSLRDMLTSALLQVWTLIYHGKSTNQIARLPAIVVKFISLHPNMTITV
jgi:hypothetical protein